MFHLSKWYLDCVTEDGRVFVAYSARLRWRALTLDYTSVLGGASSLKPCPPPECSGDRIEWRAPEVGVQGTWQALEAPVSETLYDYAAVALATVRLWTMRAPLSLIAGLYLILGGLGRFVEEAYRGEPQTPIIARLRLYQWIAIATVLAGIGLTVVRSDPAPAPQFHWGLLVPAACFGLATAFAMGVDFPESNRRFARLA